MSTLRDQIIATKFKPVAGGFIVRGPYQLGLGRVKTYFVPQARKSAVIDALVPQRPEVRSYAIAGAVLAATVASVATVYALSPHKNPTGIDTLVMMLMTAMLSLIGFAMMRWEATRRLKPLFDSLQRSNVAFTVAEQRNAMMDAMSPKTAALIVGASLFNGALMLARGLTSRDKVSAGISLALGCAALAVAAYYAFKWMRQTRASRV